MTATPTTSSTPTAGAQPPPADLVTVTIDDRPIAVPKGTLVIRAAELLGIEIPRFCDHPLLDPVGACRQCLVVVSLRGPDGVVRLMSVPGQPTVPKPQAACTMTVSDGMVVSTQYSSPVAEKAQHGVMELLLINHPLDCPVCDKGGECPLQNQAMSGGRTVTRFDDVKRTFPKPVNISSEVLLDRERCVLCQRCTRFSDQIAGDKFINLVERGAMQQIGIYQEQPFQSYFSGNTVQICPVGALTGAAYRFRSRPFDLVSTPSVCEHCASGCALRTDHRRGVVLRRMAAPDAAVNEEWNCDKGRWAFQYATLSDRLTLPLVRQPDGSLQVVGWPEALEAAAAGLRAAGSAGVLVGGRVSAEDAYAYGKFARVALGTNDIDFRARPHSADEVSFLATYVVSKSADAPAAGAAGYADLDTATAVLLVGFEPEEESPIVFLRLRKAFRRSRTRVYAVAPFSSRGLRKLSGTLLPSLPGWEADTLAQLGDTEDGAAALAALRGGGVILVGERMAMAPGALAAAAELAESTGAKLGWVPRRAGERGALEAGALGPLLPGGRPVALAGARAEVGDVWGVSSLPSAEARDTGAMLQAAASGELGALVVGGVDPADIGSTAATEALQRAFVVSLEVRESAVTEHADVILPVAAHAEKGGTFVNWEGRPRFFEQALSSNAMSDHRVLDMLAAELGVFLETRTLEQINEQFEALGPWGGNSGAVAAKPSTTRRRPSQLPPREGILATWPMLLDAGRLQHGEPFLAGTAQRAVARLGREFAARVGVRCGDEVIVSSDHGSVRVPVKVTDDLLDGVVWLPTNSAGCQVRTSLGIDAGARVTVTRPETKGGAEA
jgi:NADH-quinone oxidoreductase subunit G